jgi:single-strand DNA-binding protein
MNSVNIIGRLTRDPDIKKTEEGRTICSFTLAVDDIHSKDERTDFLRITVFGNPGDLCEKYLRKGFLTGVTGRLRNDSYADAEGKTKYVMNIIAENVRFLQWPERDENGLGVPATKAG